MRALTPKEDIEAIDRIDTLGILASINWEVSSDDEWDDIRDGFDLIPNKLRLRTLTEEEKNRLTRDFSSPSGPLKFSERDVTILELKDCNYQKLILLHYNHLKKALLAFRLLKHGYIYLDGIYPILRVPSIGKQNKFSTRHFDVTPNYEFSPREIEGLFYIFNKLESIDFENNHTFRIACKRLENSYHSFSIEDTLIDLCIAFEALFLKGEYKQSDLGMGQVIGLACSRLLGEKKKERKKISNVLGKGFSLRNRVVHGRDFNRSQIIDILPDFENYLRKSILRLIP